MIKFPRTTLFLTAACVGLFTANALAQKNPASPPLPPDNFPVVVEVHPELGAMETTERSVAVDPSVNIKLCVGEGELKVNGWSRNEIRVFVRDGSPVNVKVLENNSDSGKPNWIMIGRASRPNNLTGLESECISGASIALDVPMGASLDIRGRKTDVTVDSVRKVVAKNVEGNIVLRNISAGINAATFQGDIMAQDSTGQVSLESSTGNILAYGISSKQIGEAFRAKTASGAISLQKIANRQIEANSISGSVTFVGNFAGGGLYNFKTSNGSIELKIPETSSATFKASYGFGSFNSQIPLKILYKEDQLPVRNLGATSGGGEANVVLTTNSGSVVITKTD
jgi:hypothetical protein